MNEFLASLANHVVVGGLLGFLVDHAFSSRRQIKALESRLDTTAALAVDAERDANLALEALARRERVISDLGERVDLIATTTQSDMAELRADFAESLRLAAGHVDGDYSFLDGTRYATTEDAGPDCDCAAPCDDCIAATQIICG